jgi:hypothetical protein
MKLPVELQLLGVWSFVATSYGVPSESTETFVQRGHWAVTHDGNAYMTAYSFDKARLSGRKFQIRLFAQNDKLVVEQIDVEDSYTKRFGICRLIDSGATVELAFNIPLDGSVGPIPASFDPTSEPKGFVSIVLKRLSEQPEGPGISVGTLPQRSRPDEPVYSFGGIPLTR